MPDIPAFIAPATVAPPPASLSIHGPLLEKAIPDWLLNATPQRRTELKAADTHMPDWYVRASPAQRTALHGCCTASLNAQTLLDKAMARLEDIDTFAKPLLVSALKDRFNVELDVNETYLLLRKPIEVGIFSIEMTSFEVLKLPLLQAALHNFEALEGVSGAFHASSGFAKKTATPGVFESISPALTVAQFTTLCRSLDIGEKYQAYLKQNVPAPDTVESEGLKRTFKNAQQTALRVAAEIALLKRDIEPGDYTMMLSVINDDALVLLDGKRVSVCDFGLMGREVTGCVLFLIGDVPEYSDELILYIPNDPEYPLKRYTKAEMTALFKQRFTARDMSSPWDGSPTVYQRFFSQFVAYADRPGYFNQFTQDAPAITVGQALAPYAPLLNKLSRVEPFSSLYHINELPPAPPAPQEPNPDPFLAPGALFRLEAGITLGVVHPHRVSILPCDMWDHVFTHCHDKLIADARAHAVPSADVDARVRSAKLASLLDIGMLVLTGVSLFVPVLGELLMGVMVAQLLGEAFEAAREWSVGDRKAAKAHLIDVAQNLAFMGLMSGAGKMLGKLTAVKPEPLIEDLEQVTLPNGKTRLWRPDLSGYECPVSLDSSTSPNAFGQYALDGKTYIRLDGMTYQTTYDGPLNGWRIVHPSDPQAYQPLLIHNGAGAWRHAFERPPTWGRLTLLRRMGHVTQPFTDEQLLKIADISGVSDDTLRKMHMDNLPRPPELTQTLRLFEAEQGVTEVIEKVRNGQSINEHYLSVLPLVTELPRWPQGVTLQVFEQADLTGHSITYGAQRRLMPEAVKTPIRVCRADVMSGLLSQRILQGLDESQITHLLGADPAQFKATRPEALQGQLAEFLKTRQQEVFERLYKGSQPKAPFVEQLQRVTPGLSEPAANAVIAQADSEELGRLMNTARFPLRMLEHARWYAQHGQLSSALASLHMDNMASADGKRLALRALQKLPGWSDSVRVEIRDLSGAVIDGIGNASEPVPRYLVKSGPVYKTFGARGKALNSIPVSGDNFFPSLLSVLPDETRQAIGIADVSRHVELRKAIIDYATEHPDEMAQVLTQHQTQKTMNKPPIRLSDKRVGYHASGRGPGMDVSLMARVRAVYPGLTDQQARGYILKLRRAGQTNEQVYAHLQARLSEWQTLSSTLDAWVLGRFPTLRARAFGRREVIDSIKASWRQAPLVDQESSFNELSLIAFDPLPVITADFSHVRNLKLIVPNAEAFLARCPSVEKLEVQVMQDNTDSVFEALRNLSQLTDLSLYTPITSQVVSNLKTLTNLEKLNLTSSAKEEELSDSAALDVRGFSRLQKLQVNDSQTNQWPIGVFELPLLERLNLRTTRINNLPADLYRSQDRLLAGLSLDWSKIAREDFKPIYEYVLNRPQHVIDTSEMVRDYCLGELLRLVEMEPRYFSALRTNVAESWPDLQARFNAVEASSVQRGELDRQLEQWLDTVSQQAPERSAMSTFAAALNANWRSELVRRYLPMTERQLQAYGLWDLTRDPSVFAVSDVQLTTLPQVPAAVFAHVKTLTLKNIRVPDQHVQRFVCGFTDLRTLDLSQGELTEMLLRPGDLPLLEHLNLSHNPLTSLDVSAMSRLHSLSARGTRLRVWPVGAEHLLEPIWLDLRDTLIATLPRAALHREQVLINTHLSGTPLSVQAQTELSAARQRFEQARGLSPGELARFAEYPVPDVFPPKPSDSLSIRHLLPLLLGVTPQGAQSLQARMRRLHPGLTVDGVSLWMDKMHTQGITDLQLDQRISGWSQTFDALTQRLNGWLLIRESKGSGWLVSAQTRREAALLIIECWREGILASGSQVTAELNLTGLQLGDLPELPGSFTHVASLKLRGVRLSEQGSNGFLRSFPNVRTLDLGGNSQREALPDAVAGMTHLQRLDLSYTGFTSPETLHGSLIGLEHLQGLNLANCGLESFQLEGLGHLQNLNLQNNRLTEWPAGVWESGSLIRLNLAGNDLTSIPSQALDGTHDLLMSNTDLFGNRQLSQDALERIRAYADERRLDPVLGFSGSELDELINDSGSQRTIDSVIGSIESDEVLSDGQAGDAHLLLWLDKLATDAQPDSQALWAQLASEPGHEALFHLLARLQDTAEFNVSRADLTRRVWDVLNAAGRDSELRRVLFRLADTHGTCVDGRILTFSELEVKVYEYNALLEVDPAHLDQKGSALLNLSRQLFRLGEVEKLANQQISVSGRRADPAEVRLEYRLGLKDLLDLPGQPAYMSFGRPISGATLASALDAVHNAEASAAFYEDLIGRDYWVAYLKQKYPAAFTAMDQGWAQKHEQLESEHATLDLTYSEAATSLEIERGTELNQKLLELSRQEVAQLPAAERTPNRPGPSRS